MKDAPEGVSWWICVYGIDFSSQTSVMTIMCLSPNFPSPWRHSFKAEKLSISIKWCWRGGRKGRGSSSPMILHFRWVNWLLYSPPSQLKRRKLWWSQGNRGRKPWLLLFSGSVVSNSWRPHGLKHAKLPCPSPSPGTCSNACPLMLSNCLVLCHSLVLLPSILPSIRGFSNELALRIRWPKY